MISVEKIPNHIPVELTGKWTCSRIQKSWYKWNSN